MRFRIILTLSIIIAFTACATGRSPRLSKVELTDDVYFDFIKADSLAMAGDTQKSSAELAKLIARNPDIAFFRYLLAQNLGREKRFSDAVQVCKKALELSPDFIEARIYLGKLYATQDLHVDAVRIFEEVIHDAPKKEEVYTYLAGEYAAMRDYVRSIKALRQLLTVNPDSVVAYFYMGTIYDRNLKNPSEALRMYNSALSIDPANANVHSAMGELYLRAKQTKKALLKFQEVAHLEPDDISTQLRIALIHYELKEYAQAITIFNEIIKKNPTADKILFYLGVLYEAEKEPAKATEEFKKVPANSSYFKDARLHMAAIARLDGRVEDAVAALREAIKEKKQVPEFYEYLAAIYEEAKDYKASIAVLEDGHDAIPNDEKIAFLLGVLYEKIEDRDGAIDAMREVLKINPQNAGALNYIGYTFAERGERLDEALTLVEQALVLRPDDGYITDSLGWVYFKLGDEENALKYLQKANSLVPGEPTVLYHIGEVFLKKGDAKMALKFFEQALSAAKKKTEVDEKELGRIEGRIKEIGGS